MRSPVICGLLVAKCVVCHADEAGHQKMNQHLNPDERGETCSRGHFRGLWQCTVGFSRRLMHTGFENHI